jgi:integrase
VLARRYRVAFDDLLNDWTLMAKSKNRRDEPLRADYIKLVNLDLGGVRVESVEIDHDSPDEERKSLDALRSALSAPSGTALAPNAASGLALSELVKRYLTDAESRRGITAKTLDEYTRDFALIVEGMGNRPIDDIQASDVDAFRELLSKLPPNRSKVAVLRGKSLVELAAMEHPATLSRTTINNTLTRVAQLYKWANGRGLVTHNPAQDVQFRQELRPDEERPAFTDDDLRRLFGTTGLLGQTLKTGYQLWIPVIGYFTGARINEIAQLHLDDLRDIDGIPCFDINDGADGQSLKTLNSRRVIPMHPALVRMGLLEYRDALRTQGTIRLFPELRKRRDGYGHTASKWFSRFMSKTALPPASTGKKKVFHSFRHTIADRLEGAGTPYEAIERILGHSKAAGGSETMLRYTKDFPPSRLQKWIAAIPVPMDESAYRRAAERIGTKVTV